VWARNNSLLTIDRAAKRVPVKTERLEVWEQGELIPTIKQLRKLGHIYKKPIAVFYLSESPKDFVPLHDFRRLPGDVEELESAELGFRIRRAMDKRQIALELYEDLEGERPDVTLQCDLTDQDERISWWTKWMRNSQ
jgi:hypothetical protein